MKSTLQKFGKYTVNVLIFGLICSLYLFTAHPVVQSSAGQAVFAPVYRGHAKGKIALQVAVDWDAAALLPILDTLYSRDLAVTFAVSGVWAEEYPELLQRMVSDGHEIATMGNQTNYDGSIAWLRDDVKASLEKINAAGGGTPLLYYPGMRDTVKSARAASGLPVTVIACSVDLLSGRGNSIDILNRALENPFDGSIMLLQPTAAAQQALPSILEALKEQGFSVCTVSSVLNNNKTG